MGVTIVDSLDSLLLMNLTDQYARARNWVDLELRFGTPAQHGVNVFETTIRVLGGLLSAFALTHDELYKTRALELGVALFPAFASPTGLPFGTIDLDQGNASNPSWCGGASSTSEAGR
jgi:hypothetical protein